MSFSETITYRLDQNELTVNDGVIGIFQGFSDPITFLTTASIGRKTNIARPKTDQNGEEYPNYKIHIKMTNTKLIHSREAYTLFNLLEDFGGFTGSIIMVFSFLI